MFLFHLLPKYFTAALGPQCGWNQIQTFVVPSPVKFIILTSLLSDPSIFSGSVSFSSEHFKGICSTVNLWSCFYLPVHWPIETSPISLRKINRELLASTHTSDLTHTPDPTHTADLTHCKHLVLLSFCVSASSSSPVLPDVIT